jgi:peptidoglycan/LPS O-acetylase OafA/YrhL
VEAIRGSTTVARVQLARRRTARQVAAALAAGCATVYVLIGLDLIDPERSASEGPVLHALGIAAGVTYGIGVALLLRVDRRGYWVAGAILQAVLLLAYLLTAGSRVPAFEPWGMLLASAELLILTTLAYLVASAGGRCECVFCRHHRRVHRGRCLVVACPCEVFV